MVNLESLEETKHNGVLYPALALSAYQQWLKTTTPTTAELATRSFDIVHIGNSRKIGIGLQLVQTGFAST